MADRLLIRGDTRANLIRANPLLERREMMFEFDGSQIHAKVGNGLTRYIDLEYTIFDIIVNGASVRPVSRGRAGITIPLRSSELHNDGDGISIYISESRLLQELAKIASDISRVEGIALGANRRFPFDTVELLISWLDGEYERPDIRPEDLVVGDKFIIQDPKAPNYYWDGTRIQEDKEQKIDLSAYANREEVKALIDAAVAKRYVKRFYEIVDWSEEEPYVIEIPSSEHKLGAEFITDIYKLDTKTGKYIKFYGQPSKGRSVSIDIEGNVTITSKKPFNGKIVIMGHWIESEDSE